jgi:thiamine-phosphate pyrophosphorylase
LALFEPPRLYAILDVDLLQARQASADALLDAWLAAGVRLVQLRAKTLATGPLLTLADRFASKAAQAGATFLINDRADIARMSGAAGVHLGQTDLPPGDARRVVGPSGLIGLSTHNEQQARIAAAAPIDYMAIGPVYATSTKAQPDAVVGLDGVRRAGEIALTARLPLVAIGGITLERARAVIDAGAAAVAVIGDLLSGDPEKRAREYLRVLG